MKKLLFCLTIILAVSCSPAGRNTLLLKNKDLCVRFDTRTALVSVKDLRSGQVWVQSPFADSVAVRVCAADIRDGQIVADLDAVFPFTATLSLEGSSLTFRLSGDPEMKMDSFVYPAPFAVKDKGWYILETDGEGMLLPVDNQDYDYGDGITYFCGGGLSMAWKGLVDTDFKSGYQIVLETPFDACLRDFRQDNGLLSFCPVWLSSMQKFAYDRVVTYHFYNKGGYVAQCKTYRDYIWEKQGVKTLRQKAEEKPAVARILGATQVFTWDTGREVSLLEEMKEAGIDKLFIFWDSNHVPYPNPGYDNAIRSLGYAAGGYELFTDLHPRDSIARPFDYNGPARLRHGVYPGLFNALAARKPDGSTYFNQFGTYACPSTMQEHIVAKLDRVVKEYPHDGLFLDVYQANGLYECYSPVHPVTRQGYAESIICNYRMIEEKYGFFMGGEWGAEFAIPYSIFNQGMMTLQRPWWGSEIEDPGTIYYYGNWRNNPRPSIHLTTCTAGPTIYKYCLNETIRVPLYELVYHDAVISTWRWEDGNPRYPELWWKKDLFNMLYGTAPYWSLDRSLWEAYCKTFVQSYKQVNPWVSRVATEELTDHRFLSPDRKVQLSVFGCKKGIVVNFSDEPYSYEGLTVAPRSYAEVDM